MTGLQKLLMWKASGGGGGGLPAEYQRVKYLSRTNAQSGPYCTVNFLLSIGDEVQTAAVDKGQPGTQRAFGGQGDTELGNRMELYYNTHDIITCWTSVSDGVTINNREYGTPDRLTFTVNAEVTLTYWGIYRSGSYLFNGDLYYIKITGSDGTKKHHLIPCIRKADSEPGFYDIVTGVFYTNDAQDGEFIPGV